LRNFPRDRDMRATADAGDGELVASPVMQRPMAAFAMRARVAASVAAQRITARQNLGIVA